MAKRKGTIGLIWRTKAFFAARLTVYAVFFFATIGFVGTVFWLLRLFESQIGAQIILILVSVGGYLLGRRYLRRYLTYVGQAPHIMGMVDAIKGTKIEAGQQLVDVSTRRLEHQFDEMSRLYRLEGLAFKVLSETRGRVLGKTSFSPLPGFAKLGKVSSWILRFALTYMRDAVLGYTFYEGKQNVWKSARRGLIIYGQSQEKLAKTAVRVYALGVFLGAVIVGLLLIPTLGILEYASDPGFFTLVVLFLGVAKAGWVIKQAVFEPIALAYILPRFIQVVEQTEEDPDEPGRLEEISKRFKELTLRAESFQAPAKDRATSSKKAGPVRTTDRKSLRKPKPESEAKPEKTAAPSAKKSKAEAPDEETDAKVILDELGDLPDEIDEGDE